ncbi:MAG: homoserine kinase, partial [Eubacteriales bacterium]
EKQYLPTLLAAGNMYLIYWCLRSHYGNINLNFFEYLSYLQHLVRLMKWIEDHRQALLDIAKTI